MGKLFASLLALSISFVASATSAATNDESPVAIVTGSSYGLGKELATLAKEAGMRLVLVDMRPEPSQEMVAAFAEEGTAAVFVEADLADAAQRPQVVEAALENFGRVDYLFNNAGYSYLDGEQVDRLGPTGLRPRELPENMFSIWNSVEVTDRFGLGFGLTHQDESFINNGNSAVLPAYTRVDAAAWFDVTDEVRLQVNVENLTDTLYFPNSHATHQASVGAPFNARFSISGRF